MPIQQKQYNTDSKANFAFRAIRGTKAANEIASEYGVHPTQIAEWKKLVLERIPELFNTRGNEKQRVEEALIATLYQQIGQLKVELDWVKKISIALPLSSEPGSSQSVRRSVLLGNVS